VARPVPELLYLQRRRFGLDRSGRSVPIDSGDSGSHRQEGLWKEENRLVILFIGQELYAHVGWRVAPDLDDAASYRFFQAPGHQNQIADLKVPMLASHHGFLPNVL
jgi:hypothetical protein